MKPKPEDVLKLAAKIVDVKRELEQLQASWDALFPDAERANEITPAKSERKVRSGSGVSRILSMLAESPESTFEALPLANFLGIPLGTTRTILSKLVKKGLIEKRGAGLYGAVRNVESIAA